MLIQKPYKFHFPAMFLFMIILMLTGSSTAARHGGFGLRIIVGEPTGISIKNWLSERTAWDAAVAWSLGREDAFHLHADYLIHDFGAFKIGRNTIPFYYGIGVRMRFEDDSRLGIRVPLGINLYVEELPLDIFLEIVPILNLVPATDFDLNAAFGVRYFFR